MQMNYVTEAMHLRRRILQSRILFKFFVYLKIS